MKRVLRVTLVLLALVALASAGLLAQAGATQKPPDAKPAAPAATQKPADTAQELPADAKAFNAAAAEKNPLKRVELLEKFIADNPKAHTTLVSMAKSQITSSLVAALKEARTKYQAAVDTEIETAKKSETMPLYTTYNSIASRLSAAGVYTEEAEDFARKGLAAMDERAYMDMRKKSYDRMLANYEKAMAAQKDGKPAASPAPAAPAGPNYSFTTRDGVMQATIAPPRPAPSAPATPRPPTKPTMPTDEELRTAFKSERAGALSTLGQILTKRGKSAEGLRALKEALAANPPAYTRATIARSLYEASKGSGSDSDQLEYLTVLALSGRATADELKALDAAYRKSHGGSVDGLETMLDERWKRENVHFTVEPFTRPAGVKATGRAVLAEVFPGAG